MCKQSGIFQQELRDFVKMDLNRVESSHSVKNLTRAESSHHFFQRDSSQVWVTKKSASSRVESLTRVTLSLLSSTTLLRLENLNAKCTKLHTCSKQQLRSHVMLILYLLVQATYVWVLLFTHIPFVVNRTFNATLTKRWKHFQLTRLQRWYRIRSAGVDSGKILRFSFESEPGSMSLFNFGSSGSLCGHFLSKTWENYSCIDDCSRSLNRGWIL